LTNIQEKFMSKESEMVDGPLLEAKGGGVAAAIDAGKRIGELSAPKQVEVCDIPHMVLPEGIELESMEHLLPAPKRISKAHCFTEVDGFSHYVNEFKRSDKAITRLYLNGSGNKAEVLEIQAVLDDNAPNEPQWCSHQASLRLKFTEEWKAWMNIHKKDISHLGFIEFLQEQLHIIAEPAGADILDASRTFGAHRNATFQSVQPIEGGDLSIGFSEEVRGTTKDGSATLPSRLKLILRPFMAIPEVFNVDAVVTWRLGRDNTLAFNISLLRIESVLEEATLKVREAVEKQTDLKILA
jgi:uncharacterized protein YfdQ (DUF2303 family)